MKQIAKVVTGQNVEGSSAYLSIDPQSFTCPIQNPEDCFNLTYLCDVFKNRANRLDRRPEKKILT